MTSFSYLFDVCIPRVSVVSFVIPKAVDVILRYRGNGNDAGRTVEQVVQNGIAH